MVLVMYCQPYRGGTHSMYNSSTGRTFIPELRCASHHIPLMVWTWTVGVCKPGYMHDFISPAENECRCRSSTSSGTTRASDMYRIYIPRIYQQCNMNTCDSKQYMCLVCETYPEYIRERAYAYSSSIALQLSLVSFSMGKSVERTQLFAVSLISILWHNDHHLCTAPLTLEIASNSNISPQCCNRFRNLAKLQPAAFEAGDDDPSNNHIMPQICRLVASSFDKWGT